MNTYEHDDGQESKKLGHNHVLPPRAISYLDEADSLMLANITKAEAINEFLPRHCF